MVLEKTSSLIISMGESSYSEDEKDSDNDDDMDIGEEEVKPAMINEQYANGIN
jgi:hypothetical protein